MITVISEKRKGTVNRNCSSVTGSCLFMANPTLEKCKYVENLHKLYPNIKTSSLHFYNNKIFYIIFLYYKHFNSNKNIVI